jgi:ketosteroid isomerase-like protein
MAGGSNRETVDKYYASLNARRWDEFAELFEPNLVLEWPQSGERIRAIGNARSVLENYPDLPTGDVTRVVGAEDKWVLTPMFSPLRITGTGDTYTAEAQTTYPNGEVWHTVDILQFRNGKISRVTEYFGPPYPPPEWRSKWVERIGDVAGPPPEEG